MNQADLLNALYDVRIEIKAVRAQLRRLDRQGIDPQFERDDLDKLKDKLALLLEERWKGVVRVRRTALPFSTRWNRTGRVLPKQGK